MKLWKHSLLWIIYAMGADLLYKCYRNDDMYSIVCWAHAHTCFLLFVNLLHFAWSSSSTTLKHFPDDELCFVCLYAKYVHKVKIDILADNFCWRSSRVFGICMRKWKRNDAIKEQERIKQLCLRPLFLWEVLKGCCGAAAPLGQTISDILNEKIEDSD